MKPRSLFGHLAWTMGAREPAHDYGIFRTAFVDGRHPQVDHGKRFSVIDCGDWVNVIALTAAQEVVLVRQFRAGTGQVCLEIPGGMVDAGEAPEVAAARELFEETGYRAPTWRQLGKVAPNPAIFGNRLHVFLAEGAVSAGAPEPEGSEVIDVELQPLSVTWRLIREGAIDHALVVAAFAHLAALQAP
ncbi:MAG TPA: NUDIX hydrolase [Kofleriaceae bacterium]|nr:NUDIX hydrolase [Kofleriaceae bacterium]